MTTRTDTTAIRGRLMELLEECTAGAIAPDPTDSGPDSIRRLGVTSTSMLEFLVAVEDEFGIEWDDDVDEETFRSFDAIAAHIAAERGL
jgi:acyl carrier protein